MNDNEIVLGKVKELFNNTLKELIEIKDTLIVLRSSEKNIAEDYTFLGMDAIEMLIDPFTLLVQQIENITNEPLNISNLHSKAKEIDSIFFEVCGKYFISTLQLYIIYTQSDISHPNISFKEEVFDEDLEVVKSNGAIAKRTLNRFLDVYNETGRRCLDLLPEELKVKTA
jgi:hypothetical protein